MSFFSNFFGSSAQADIRKANKQATNALETGYGQQTQFYDQAAGLYNPYVTEGRNASTRYNDLLGLNGAGAAGTAYSDLASLPAFQGQLASDSNAVLKNLNARGMGGGGTAAMAGQRVFQQNIGNWLDRYAQAGRDGFQATNSLANVRQTQGDNAMGYGATRANQATQYGNAMAQSRNIGINNLIGLVGAVGNAYGSMMKPPGVR